MASDWMRLEAEAQAASGQGFANLESAARENLLASVETGDVTADWLVSPARFFALLVRHTMEGLLRRPGQWRQPGWHRVGDDRL